MKTSNNSATPIIATMRPARFRILRGVITRSMALPAAGLRDFGSGGIIRTTFMELPSAKQAIAVPASGRTFSLGESQML
jgi:hypothetical protein